MRKLLLMLCASFTFGACHCGAPANPTPVTLRIKNTSTQALFVEDGDGGIGLQVQEQISGTWTTEGESVPCDCDLCSNVCGGSCSPCDAGTSSQRVLMIPPGSTAERQWGGVLAQSASNSCGQLVGSTACMNATNIAGDQTVQLHFCYALTATLYQPTDGGTPVGGYVDPASLLCVDRKFQPKDGVVEVSPVQGGTCTQQSDCVVDAGELCLGGNCTTVCPPNNFPAIGGSWVVSILPGGESPFYAQAINGPYSTWTGEGFVKSATYTNDVMSVSLVTDAGAMGSFSAQLPAGFAVPLQQFDLISIKAIAATSGTGPNSALVLRTGDGTLLLAADSAQGAPLLSPSDTAPFTVTNPGNIAGCVFDQCGKSVEYTSVFTGGLTPVELNPGANALEVANGVSFNLLNVGDQSVVSPTNCLVTHQTPYVIANPRTSH